MKSDAPLTPSQKLLLQAVLRPDATVAAAAWRRWLAAVELDTLPASQHPLLPRLYASLTRLGLDDEAAPRLKGIYRRPAE